MVKKHLRRKPLKREQKIEERVFNTSTLGNLRRLMKLEIIDKMGGPIAMGKEANIFLAFLKAEPRIVKIFRIETGSFRNILPYVEGDPRFHSSKRKREFFEEWAKKEFRNLSRAYYAGIKVPKPHKVLKNILVMDFIGTEAGDPAPQLNTFKTEQIKNPKKLYETLLGYLRDLYQKAKLVHADFSEFNVLVPTLNEPYLVDFAQAVLVKQPMAQEFLERDADNLIRYFRKFGMKLDKGGILKEITAKI